MIPDSLCFLFGENVHEQYDILATFQIEPNFILIVIEDERWIMFIMSLNFDGQGSYLSENCQFHLEHLHRSIIV